MATRLKKEAEALAKEDLDWASAEPKGDDLFSWEVSVAGPPSSPYEGGLFNLEMKMPANYPFAPPAIKFVTKIYHPSVATESGDICQDILKESWKPTMNIRMVLEIIRHMLAEPNTDSPLEPSISELLQNNPEEFAKKAKEFTEKFAT